MAKKDFTIEENTDRGKEDGQSHHDTTKQFPPEAAGVGEVNVKNAHASGDGSFGRNDGSLPEEEPEVNEKDDSTY